MLLSSTPNNHFLYALEINLSLYTLLSKIVLYKQDSCKLKCITSLSMTLLKISRSKKNTFCFSYKNVSSCNFKQHVVMMVISG